MGLLKEYAELLGSRLRQKNLLAPGTSFSWFRHRERDFLPYFLEEGDLVYCSDIPRLMSRFNVKYEVSDWSLFINSSKRILKAMLLHNYNKYISVTVERSVHLEEQYKNLAFIHSKQKYSDNGWAVCSDLKVMSMVLRQQGGCTKYLRFFCASATVEIAIVLTKEWPERVTLEPRRKM